LLGQDDSPRARTKPEAAAVEAIHLTDMGNAQRLVRLCGADFRHCHPWGNDLVWDDQRWREDDTAQLARWAKDTGRQMYAEAADLIDTDERTALARHAAKSEDVRRINAMMALARSEPGVPVLPADLNRDGWLLNCVNGTVDLRTGRLREHRPADLITA